jgi:hypothetical protein
MRTNPEKQFPSSHTYPHSLRGIWPLWAIWVAYAAFTALILSDHHGDERGIAYLIAVICAMLLVGLVLCHAGIVRPGQVSAAGAILQVVLMAAMLVLVGGRGGVGEIVAFNGSIAALFAAMAFYSSQRLRDLVVRWELRRRARQGPGSERRLWSWWLFAFALGTTLAGWAGIFVYVLAVMGAASGGDPSDKWLVPLSELLLWTCPLLIGAGALWALFLLVRLGFRLFARHLLVKSDPPSSP